MKAFRCSFDPVSAAEVRELLKIRRERGLHDLYVCVKAEGCLGIPERERLLKAALRPYRRLHVIPSADEYEDIPERDEERIRHGEFRLAAEGTRRILLEEGFFLEETARHMCNERRFTHSRGVAETARMLAHAHRLDEMKAERAGWLHDITKKMPDEEAEKIIARYKPDWLCISPKVWHSYTAVIWLKQNMGMYDRDILHAIEHHTLGDGHSDLDRILYISDKIEPGRGYDVSSQTALAKKSLKAGADTVLAESKTYIFEKEGIHV